MTRLQQPERGDEIKRIGEQVRRHSAPPRTVQVALNGINAPRNIDSRKRPSRCHSHATIPPIARHDKTPPDPGYQRSSPTHLLSNGYAKTPTTTVSSGGERMIKFPQRVTHGADWRRIGHALSLQIEIGVVVDRKQRITGRDGAVDQKGATSADHDCRRPGHVPQPTAVGVASGHQQKMTAGAMQGDRGDSGQAARRR